MLMQLVYILGQKKKADRMLILCSCAVRFAEVFVPDGTNDRRPSQKSGTRRENRNSPDSPDLYPSIPNNRGYLRFRVFISRQVWDSWETVKSPIAWDFPDRHMKTRL